MDPIYSHFDREIPIINKGVYFHGTRLHFVESILRKGLDPKRMRREWRMCEWEHAKEYDPKRRLRDQPNWTYLSSFYDWAYGWAKRLFNDPIVLQIDAPKELRDQFITNLGEFIRVPVIIPTKFLSVADPNIERYRKLTAEEREAEIAEFERLKTKYPERYQEILQMVPERRLVVPWFVNTAEEKK